MFLQRAALIALLSCCGFAQAQQSWWDEQKSQPSVKPVSGGVPESLGAQSQSPVLMAAPVTQVVSKVLIPEGTDVRLRMLDKLSSATAAEGQRFNLELEDDIVINGLVAIPHGAKAVGTVVSAKKKGFMGRGGDLNILIDYLLYKNQRVRLRAGSGREGKDKVGTAVTLTVLFGPLGLLKRGHDAEINPGAIMNAYVDQSIEIVP